MSEPHGFAENVRPTVTVDRYSLTLVLDRYQRGDTTKDEPSDDAVQALRTALWVQRAAHNDGQREGHADAT